jgi:hypothetical protein
MGPLTLALLFSAVFGVAFAMARVAERRGGEGWGAFVFAGVVAVPFGILTISPLLAGDHEKAAGSSHVVPGRAVAPAFEPRLKQSGFTVELPDRTGAIRVYGAERHRDCARGSVCTTTRTGL